MKKRVVSAIAVMVLVLVVAASAALAAARYSEWIPARNYPNVYHQVANWSGGDNPEAVRFANQNPHRIKIHVVFTYRPNNTNVGERMVYLGGGNTYSEWVQLGPNVTYNFTVSKD